MKRARQSVVDNGAPPAMRSVRQQSETRGGPFGTSQDADSSLKSMLDQIDNVRQALSGLKNAEGNQIFYEELLASLPQFVVCGPQSAGKSSVIRRISGISLPEASTLCTRIATVIQMRREQQISVEVCLKGPDGEDCWSEKVGDQDLNSVKELVKKAQDEALAKNGNTTQFVDNHTVLIKVFGPDRQNLTLVDLPGFHNSSDVESKTVNEMVKRYIGMSGTLAMHVVKGDQDYDSILGNDFMRSHKVDRVTVLTHCDKIDDSTECVTRLQETLRKASETSSMTFAVHGSSKSQEEEDNSLLHMQVFRNEVFDIGAAPLARHLEQRMRRHLETQLPLALAKMQASLEDTSSLLQRMERKSPSQHIAILVQTIRQNFAAEKKVLMDKVRDQVLEMVMDIRNFCLEPMDRLPSRNRRDKFEEDLEAGMQVRISGWRSEFKITEIPANDNGMRNTALVSVTEVSKDTGVKWTRIDGLVPETGLTSMDHVWSAEVRGVDNVIEEITQMARSRGLRNLMHADRQPIIEVYAQRFAAHYKAILAKHGRVVQSLVKSAMDSAFSRDVDEAAACVARQLRAEMAGLEDQAHTNTEAAFQMIEEHNTNPDLIFTTNDHYLNDLVQKMVAADREMANDIGSSRHIYHNVRAFLKVQRKQVSELAAKELTRTAVLDVAVSLNRLLVADMTDFHEMLTEETETVRKTRTKLETRKTILEQALAILPSKQTPNRLLRRF